jgi:hypothetical protein
MHFAIADRKSRSAERGASGAQRGHAPSTYAAIDAIYMTVKITLNIVVPQTAPMDDGLT